MSVQFGVGVSELIVESVCVGKSELFCDISSEFSITTVVTPVLVLANDDEFPLSVCACSSELSSESKEERKQMFEQEHRLICGIVLVDAVATHPL